MRELINVAPSLIVTLWNRILFLSYKFKEQNILCAHEFSWFVKKIVYTTCGVHGILALISGANFVEDILLGKSETVYFSALFHKKKIILKE